MTGAIQGTEHRARISAALTFVGYADSGLHELPSHAVVQMFALAAHLADRRGGLDEDALADDLVAAGWHRHDDVPASGTQQVLEVIGSGVGWWQAAWANRDGQAAYGSDATVRATAAGLVPGAAMGGVAQLARRSSIITHCHPDARDAAAVQACATALACTEPNADHIDIEKYIGELSAQCRGKLMASQLAVVSGLVYDNATPQQARATFGDSAAAPATVAAALTGFLCHPGQPLAVIKWVQAMGPQWHASALMAAALAAAAHPHARPPITWRAGARRQAEIDAVATTLAAASAPPYRRWLIAMGQRPRTEPRPDGLSHNCHGSGETPPHLLGNLTVRPGHHGQEGAPMGGTSTATQRIPIVEVVVAGDLDVLAVPTVAAALERAATLRPQQLIIDLAQCPTIDAAGIVLLLEAHRRAIRYGGTLALRSPSAKLQRNLRLSKLDRVLHVLAPCPEEQYDNERLVP